MPQIPSHVKPCLDALIKELIEVESWIKEGEEALERQKQHISNYKVIAERKIKEINIG